MYFKNVQFDNAALKTEFGAKLYTDMKKRGLEVKIGNSKINNENAGERYREGKKTLLITSRSPYKFENCRPSADYQLPILSGCPGLCEYCYLMTRTGEKSVIKLNANIDKIFTLIDEYIISAEKRPVYFELSASSDPIPFEETTKIVSFVIDHFGKLTDGYLRICTKYEPTESILNTNHNNHTDFRFSLNTPYVIDNFEYATPSLDRRILALKKTIEAGYKTGVMLAPIFLYDNWQNDYIILLDKIEAFAGDNLTSFEAVTHRYTNKARETIQNIFPQTKLDMNDDKRKYKMGQFGYGKFVYDKDDMNTVKEFFAKEIEKRFPSSKLLYIV